MNFDPASHEYSDNGIIIKSVTQILGRAGIINDRWFTEEARERGSAVHDLCERYAHGKRYSDNGIPLDQYEYVNAFSAWMRDTGAYPIAVECIISGELNGYRYAGKFDLLAEIDGKRVLVDLKTGAKAKWHTTQLAAYSLGFLTTGERVNPDRMSDVYLKPNGLYLESKIQAGELLAGIAQFKEALYA